MPVADAMTAIEGFLPCPTPQAWIERALNEQEILLIDHAQCEKKAASTALSMLYRYPQHAPLIHRMSKIAREELRHFEQVLKIMQGRGIAYRHLSPARYAAGLHVGIRTPEPHRLIDSLIVGAFIEARSCERFAAIAPYLDETLQTFYQGLLASEARHYRVYLDLAAGFCDHDHELQSRIEVFCALERDLIEQPDSLFRFHSGVPV